MKAYRYNARKREDRKFNNCGFEKNPNNIKFYAKSLEYVEDYRFIRGEMGEIVYECDLEVIDVLEDQLFDMELNYSLLSTFEKYVDNQIKIFLSNQEMFNRLSGKKSKISINLDQIKNSVKLMDFQSLSDGEIQNDLVSELKSLGFKGYQTKNEIAIL